MNVTWFFVYQIIAPSWALMITANTTVVGIAIWMLGRS